MEVILISAILLTNTPTDSSYEHVLDFEMPNQTWDFYKNQPYARMLEEINIPVDPYRSSVELDIDINELLRYDYLVLLGNGQKYYYFIQGAIQKGYLTVLSLELDVWNTFYWQIKINDSFVDRCHVDRFERDRNSGSFYAKKWLQDEGIEFGHLVEKEHFIANSRVPKYKDMNYRFILASKEPLGTITNRDKGGSEGTPEPTPPPSEEKWRKGEPSRQLLRFLKGYEAFASNIYRDSGGVQTVGYGITTSIPTYWNEITSSLPCTEEQASRVMYKAVINRFAKPILSRCIELGVTEQHQFDALVSLAMNCGPGVVMNNNSLTRAIKSGKSSAIISAWENFYIHDSKGNRLQGLILRRKAEYQMFLSARYENRRIPTVNSNGYITGYIDGDGWLP